MFLATRMINVNLDFFSEWNIIQIHFEAETITSTTAISSSKNFESSKNIDRSISLVEQLNLDRFVSNTPSVTRVGLIHHSSLCFVFIMIHHFLPSLFFICFVDLIFFCPKFFPVKSFSNWSKNNKLQAICGRTIVHKTIVWT